MVYTSKQAFCFALVVLTALIVVEQCAAQNWQQDFLRLHNRARTAVGVRPVHWDNKAAAYASRYAQQRQRDCALRHSPYPRPYGENIYSAWGRSGTSASDAMDSWVKEKQFYNYRSNSCARGQTCEHYTQVVWRDTTGIGCARVFCNNNRGVFIICSYSPPGNIRGRRPY